MLTVLSPAKTLDYDTPLPPDLAVTWPDFLADSHELVTVLQALTPADIAQLMSLSDKLASLNAARFAQWQPSYQMPEARPAVFAFKGDVYTGLQVEDWSQADIDHAQNQLRILSGLYGLLRPLDLMLPYRLEMGTNLATPRGQGLYAFWGQRLAFALNEALVAQGDDILVNLASQEYFKSVPLRALEARVISPQFRDEKQGQFKVISFYAKKARGLMAAWMIQQRLTHPDQLLGFDRAGYRYEPDLSKPDEPVFIRPASALP